MKNKFIRILVALVLGSIVAYQTNSLNEILSIAFLIKVLFNSAVLFFALKQIDLKRKWLWVCAFLLASLTSLGKSYNDYGTVFKPNTLYFIVPLIFSYYVNICFLSDFKMPEKKGRFISLFDKTWFRVLIICIGWSFVALSIYPGIIYVDTKLGINDIYNNNYSLHTSFLYSCIVSGIYGLIGLFTDSNAPVVVITLLNAFSVVVILDACIKTINPAPIWKMFITLHFALNLNIQLWAFNVCKDVLFSMLFLLFILKTYVYLTKDLKHYCRDTFSILLSLCLMRNNMVYILIIWAIILFIQKQKKTALMSLIVCLLFFGYKFIATNMLGFENDAIQESMSVPLQQMAYVYSQDKMSKEDIKYIKTLFKNPEGTFTWDYYYPTLADEAKKGFKEITPEFISLYLKTGIENPKDYIDAFVGLTYYSYYPDNILNIYANTAYKNFSENIYGDNFVEENIEYDTNFYAFAPSFNVSEGIFYEGYILLYKICWFANTEYIPIFSKTINITTFLYLFLITFFISLERKQYKITIALLPALLLLLTCYLGPCVLIRYYLLFIYSAPFMLWFIYESRKENICKNQII